MAKLEAYDKTLDYSYAPGIFPATECLKNAKKRCMRLLVSSNGLQSEGVQALEKAAQEADIRVEVADRALERISKKENCFAAMVYKKAEGRFDEDSPHIVLHHGARLWAEKHRDHPSSRRFGRSPRGARVDGRGVFAQRAPL